MFKVNNWNTRLRCEICSKLTIKTSERRHWRRSGVLLLTLNIFHTLFQCFCCSLWASNCRLGPSEAYSEPCQTSKMKFFAKIVNDLQPLTIFKISSVLDVWLWSSHNIHFIFFYKQLGSGLSSQSCLYFRGLRGSKLLNGCLAWLSNRCLRGMQ